MILTAGKAAGFAQSWMHGKSANAQTGLVPGLGQRETVANAPSHTWQREHDVVWSQGVAWIGGLLISC